jgi:hypothetical protein
MELHVEKGLYQISLIITMLVSSSVLKKRPGKLPIIVAISLGLHLLVLYALIQSHSFEATYLDNVEPGIPSTIKARLVFTPLNSPSESREDTETLPTVVKNEVIIPENVSVQEQIANIEEAAFAVSDEAVTRPPIDNLPAQQSLQKSPLPNIYHNAPDIARRQLNSLNQAKLQDLAQQAAKEYQEQKSSPNLDLKPVDPKVTEDEKLRDSVQVRVNCDSNTNKIASVLSGFMGGTLKCTEGPEINSFIQNRLNKTDLLPAKENP